LRALLVPFGLGSTPFVLYINPFVALLCLSCKVWRSLSHFFSSLAFGGFYFLFIVAQLHACVVCIALPTGLAVVATQGFYFAFFVFFLFLENKYALAQRGSKG